MMAHVQNLEAPCKGDAIRIEDLATQCLCPLRRTIIWQWRDQASAAPSIALQHGARVMPQLCKRSPAFYG